MRIRQQAAQKGFEHQTERSQTTAFSRVALGAWRVARGAFAALRFSLGEGDDGPQPHRADLELLGLQGLRGLPTGAVFAAVCGVRFRWLRGPGSFLFFSRGQRQRSLAKIST